MKYCARALEKAIKGEQIRQEKGYSPFRGKTVRKNYII